MQCSYYPMSMITIPREKSCKLVNTHGSSPLPWKMLPIHLPNSTHITFIYANYSHTLSLLFLLWTKGYIGEFEIIDDHRSNKIVVELNGRLNKCGVISPRFDVGVNEIEKWVVNLLPSRQFGHILISTTYGIMTHEEARRKKTGGKILGFFYWRGNRGC